MLYTCMQLLSKLILILNVVFDRAGQFLESLIKVKDEPFYKVNATYQICRKFTKGHWDVLPVIWIYFFHRIVEECL
jgi:hypothetical protein